MTNTDTMKLTAIQRFLLLQTIPPNTGSLDELVAIKGLRNRLEFSEAEKETIEWTEGPRGQTSFNGEKLVELGDTELDLSEKERGVIASGFLLREANENLPTNEAFIDLYLAFKDDIDAKKDD
jgi:hypothetical protein